MRRLHVHVTPFSAATILVFATASPLHAQGIEVLGGYSVNADYVQNRPAILIGMV
jgi:CBS-domain-containing membrane protein